MVQKAVSLKPDAVKVLDKVIKNTGMSYSEAILYKENMLSEYRRQIKELKEQLNTKQTFNKGI